MGQGHGTRRRAVDGLVRLRWHGGAATRSKLGSGSAGSGAELRPRDILGSARRGAGMTAWSGPGGVMRCSGPHHRRVCRFELL